MSKRRNEIAFVRVAVYHDREPEVGAARYPRMVDSRATGGAPFWPRDLDALAAARGVSPNSLKPRRAAEPSAALLRYVKERGDRCVRGCKWPGGALGLCKACWRGR